MRYRHRKTQHNKTYLFERKGHVVKIGKKNQIIERKKEILPKTSHGSTTHNEYVIIEIETENGVVGVGEVTCAVGWNGEEGVGSADLLKRKIAPALTGIEVGNWLDISLAIEQWTRHRPFLRAGVEMACLDVEGKLSNKNDRYGKFSTKYLLS